MIPKDQSSIGQHFFHSNAFQCVVICYLDVILNVRRQMYAQVVKKVMQLLLLSRLCKCVIMLQANVYLSAGG